MPRVCTLSVLFACAALAGSDDLPGANRPGESAWIPLHHQLQERNLCVPTSASIVLDYFGDHLTPREIKELAVKWEYKPGDSFHDFTITFYRDLIAGLARRGYRWQEKNYPDNGGGLKRGLSDVEQWLDRGIPVMIDTNLGSNGHTMVVAGYSKAEKKLYLIDPAMRSPGIRFVTFAALNRIWNSRALGFKARGAVFPQRR